MPDTIRITGGGVWVQRGRSGYRTAIAAGLGWATAPVVAALPAHAQVADRVIHQAPVPTIGAYMSAIAQLDRHEIAALALTLGILCFAVVTAIMLVRTRRRLAAMSESARDEAMASRAAIDRAYALLLSEPQILIVWSTGTEEPEIIGDAPRVIGAGVRQRVL